MVGPCGGLAAAWLSLCLVVGACGSSTRPDAPASASPRLVSTREYRPGLAADLFLPERMGIVPLVVMVPGGAWISADRSGLAPLAETLAAHGVVVVNATHRAASSSVRFPTPVEDVACSVDFAVTWAAGLGRRGGPLVVLGHSTGAHLAALEVLRPSQFSANCCSVSIEPDGLIGLAGTFDVDRLVDVAWPLFGARPDEQPDAWREGNPVRWADQRPTVPVFLAHGDRDDLVAPSFSIEFAGALSAAGHPVRLDLVPGADHQLIYTPAVIAPRILTWIQSRWPDAAPGGHRSSL